MRRSGITRPAAVAAGTTLMLVLGLTEPIATARPDQETARRLQAMSDAGAAASLTVESVTLAGKPFDRVAELVALFLEQADMQELAVGGSTFAPPADADLEGAAAAFGEHVAQNPPATDYSLFGAYVGSPGTGFREVWGIVVDRKGRPVWIDRQTPGDADPMTCSILLAERLRLQLGLEDPMRDDAPKGPMAALMQRRSGLPADSEIAALDERCESLKSATGPVTLAVYPVRIRDAVDSPSAEKLVAMINEAGLCRAELATASPHFDVAPDPNEAKLLWTLAGGFREYLGGHPPDTDYVLYADFIMDTAAGHVGAVHFVVCDRRGDWVIVDLQNNHHEDFQAVAPASRDDCCALVTRRLAGYIQ